MTAGRVVRNLWPDFGEFKGLHILRQLCHDRRGEGFEVCEGRHDRNVFSTGPADASFNKIREARIGEGALIVSPGGVEDSTFAMRSDPRPRFPGVARSLFAFYTVLKNRSVFFVVQMMNVCFIPARETAEVFHNGMSRLSNLSSKHLPTVSLELRSHQLHHLRIIPPAERRTVQRNKAFAAGNIVLNRLGLRVFDLVDVGIQNQPIEARQCFRGQIFHPVRVLQLNASSFQHRSQFMKSLRRPMMTVVAHEEQFKVGSGGAAGGC